MWTKWLHHRVISPNDADRIANSVDPDQTALLGAVWSGSALFAQAYLSENLGSLRYTILYVGHSKSKRVAMFHSPVSAVVSIPEEIVQSYKGALSVNF